LLIILFKNLKLGIIIKYNIKESYLINIENYSPVIKTEIA